MNADELSIEEVRIVQAMADFQMALSAVDFLCEADPDIAITRVERRRLRCFEDAAVVNYWRPFTQSSGLPSLSLKKLGIKPTEDQSALHDRIKDRRNKVVAHTDVDRMRLAFSTFKVFEDHDLLMPHYDFDDSLYFFEDRIALMIWLRTLRQAAAHILFNRVQGRPAVRFKRDHLEDDAKPSSGAS